MRRGDGSKLRVNFGVPLAVPDDISFKAVNEVELQCVVAANEIYDAQHEVDRFFDLLEPFAVGCRHTNREVTHTYR
jgi:hypothetical protein